METYLIYIGKVALAAGAFYIAFLLLFQNQKQFVFNRLYLPVSLAVSFLIPLITFTTIKYIEPINFDNNSFTYLTESSEVQQPEFVWEWYHYLFGLYLIGIAGFLFHLLLGHIKAIKIIQKSRVQKIFQSLVNITKKDVHPFSFFNKIVLSEKTLFHPDLEMIVSHEKIHVREKHTFDILFAEILFLFQWFNPFAWLIKDAVKNNLEYLTDNEIAKHYNSQTYQLAMVGLADKKGVAPFLTALNGSQLKNRIVMMKKKTENKFAVLKQLAILPLLAILVMGLSNKEIKTEILQVEQTEIQNGIIIKGKVTDEKGAPIEGALIEVKGRQYGVITDNKGNYKIEIEPSDETLIYGFLHHDKKEVSINGKTKIDVQLKTDGNPTTDGVFLHNSFRMRTSNGELAKPIYVVDGIVDVDINRINTDNIEKIDVLKGESGFKLYGEKGKNGVVLITTKKVDKNTKPEEIKITGDVSYKSQQPQNGGFAISGGLNGTVANGSENMIITPSSPNGLTIKSTGDQTGQPLYFIDGVETTNIDHLPNNIESIAVFKDKTATEFYGEKGKNGVVMITLKKAGEIKLFGDIKAAGFSTQPEPNAPIKSADNNGVGFDFGRFKDVDPSKPPLYIVDGIENNNIDNIAADNIESISVLRDKSATILYGEKGKNGVILITTKNKEKIEPAKVFGNNQVIGNINWINNEKYNSKELTNLLGIKKGDDYSKEIIEERVYGRVSDLYMDNGYLFFNITIAERKKENGIVDLDLTVFEGTQWKIGKIEITGNETVSAKEYLNKIEIKSGNLFSRSKLNQSVRTLNELIKQNAEEVDVDVNPILESQGNEFRLVNLVFKIKEKNGENLINTKTKYTTCDDEPSFYMSIENSKVLDLRSKIAQSIKYPVSAQENNQQGVVEIWAFIEKDGTITRITDKRPDGKFINVDEVVVTAYKSEKAVTSEKSNDLALLVKESKRVIEKLSPFKVPELLGEMVCFRIKFVLQD